MPSGFDRRCLGHPPNSSLQRQLKPLPTIPGSLRELVQAYLVPAISQPIAKVRNPPIRDSLSCEGERPEWDRETLLPSAYLRSLIDYSRR
jgi:hypothetical protein